MTRHKASCKRQCTCDRRPNSTSTNVVDPMSGNPNWLPDKPFRFLDLPSELRISVYTYLLPNGLDIDLSHRSTRWLARTSENVTRTVARWRPQLTNSSSNAHSWTIGNLIQNTGMELFCVSKFLSAETRAVLYGSNTFMVMIDAEPRDTASLSTTSIFGPLGESHVIHLLRDLRSICVILTPARHSQYWVHCRHRGRLARFVEILQQYAEDADKGSLLTDLVVRLEQQGRSQFVLEALAPLRGIKNVSITGSLTPWFARCLTLCIQGAGEVQKAVYEETGVKKRVGTPQNRKWKKCVVSEKKWYMPEMDWIPFALHNGIDMPGDVQKFWETEMDENGKVGMGKGKARESATRPESPGRRLGYTGDGSLPN